MSREEIIQIAKCDEWKKKETPQLHWRWTRWRRVKTTRGHDSVVCVVIVLRMLRWDILIFYFWPKSMYFKKLQYTLSIIFMIYYTSCTVNLAMFKFASLAETSWLPGCVRIWMNYTIHKHIYAFSEIHFFAFSMWMLAISAYFKVPSAICFQ